MSLPFLEILWSKFFEVVGTFFLFCRLWINNSWQLLSGFVPWTEIEKQKEFAAVAVEKKTILFVTDDIVVWVISVPLLKSQLSIIVIVLDVHDVVFAVDFICRDRRISFFLLFRMSVNIDWLRREFKWTIQHGAISHESNWDLQQLLKTTSQVKRNASFYFWPQNHQRKVFETKIYGKPRITCKP